MDESIMYAEVYEVLKVLGQNYISRIPNNFYKFIEENRDKNIIITFNVNEPIEKQKISDEAIEFISLLNLKYWCTNIEMKQLIQIYNNNELKYQKELREKYNPDNILKNRNTNVEKMKNTSLVTYRKSLFSKILDVIKKAFHRNI